MTRTDIKLEAHLAREVVDMLAEAGMDDDFENVQITIESETDFQSAIERVLVRKLDDDALVKAIQLRIDELKLRQERIAHRAQQHVDALVDAFSIAGLSKLQLPSGTVSIVKGRTGVNIIDTDRLPDVYTRTQITRSADKAAIKSALERGESVPGAELTNSPNHLAIRRT